MVEASVEVLRYAFQEAKDIVRTQAETLDNLRSNASTLLGFDGVVLSLGFAGFAFFRREGVRLLDVPAATIWLALGTLAILASTFLAGRCLFPRSLFGGLRADKLVAVMDHDVDETGFLVEAVRTYEQLIVANTEILDSTASDQSRAARALLFGMALYAVGAAVLIYHGV